MAGRDKFAERMAAHLQQPIDAACPINRPGGTAVEIGGGAIGAVIHGKTSKAKSDIDVGSYGWLGLGPTHFALTKAAFSGKPTGEPLAWVPYTDVTGVALTEGKLTLRVDLDLADGRHVAFESKRRGRGTTSVEVLEQLRDRCPPQ